MSKFEKVLDHLLNPSANLTFQELTYILNKLDYEEKKTGKTSGSRIAYIHIKTQHILRIHRPHPGNELKKYVKCYIVEELKKNNLI